MAQPEVSVIVPVWNAMPYLVTCLSSVMEQTLGRERLELLAVDDGSTDGSGEQLDLLARAWPGLRVLHEKASGGPSRPRNAGLDQASGRYVFFLDADDFLAPEALQRMLNLADQTGCDVVACARAAVGGRKGIVDPTDHVPLAGRPRHEGIAVAGYDAAVRRSTAAGEWSALLIALSDCKNLFRRARIEALGARFAPDLHFGEDAAFSAGCVQASSVGLIDDYDCYYERVREDGGNITTRMIGTPRHVESLERGVRLQSQYPELDWRRDLYVRDAVLDLTQQVFGERFLERDPELTRQLMELAGRLVGEWLTPRAAGRLPVLDRLKVELITRGAQTQMRELVAAVAAGGRGRDVVRAGRVYAGLPFFDDPVLGIPPECHDLTAELAVHHRLAEAGWQGTKLRLAGQAYIEHVDTIDVTTQLVLRERSGRTHRRPVRSMPAADLPSESLPSESLPGESLAGPYDYRAAGFELVVDLADLDGRALEPGRWGCFLEVGAQGVSRQVPLGGNRADDVEAALLGQVTLTATTAGGGTTAVTTVRASFSRFGTLTLDVRVDSADVD